MFQLLNLKTPVLSARWGQVLMCQWKVAARNSCFEGAVVATARIQCLLAFLCSVISNLLPTSEIILSSGGDSPLDKVNVKSEPRILARTQDVPAAFRNHEVYPFMNAFWHCVFYQWTIQFNSSSCMILPLIPACMGDTGRNTCYVGAILCIEKWGGLRDC